MSSTEEYQQAEFWNTELEKCKNDEYYLYSQYFTINGVKPNITREEFYIRKSRFENLIKKYERR